VRRAARLRLLACALRVQAARERHQWAEMAEWQSRACDARAALSLACGAGPGDVDPVTGCWDAPAEPVQLVLDVAA
jgi:hypothetical protein